MNLPHLRHRVVALVSYLLHVTTIAPFVVLSFAGRVGATWPEARGQVTLSGDSLVWLMLRCPVVLLGDTCSILFGSVGRFSFDVASSIFFVRL